MRILDELIDDGVGRPSVLLVEFSAYALHSDEESAIDSDLISSPVSIEEMLFP